MERGLFGREIPLEDYADNPKVGILRSGGHRRLRGVTALVQRPVVPSLGLISLTLVQ